MSPAPESFGFDDFELSAFGFARGAHLHKGTDGVRHAASPPDDPAHVRLRDVQLKDHIRPRLDLGDDDLPGIVYERFGNVFDQVFQRTTLSSRPRPFAAWTAA